MTLYTSLMRQFDSLSPEWQMVLVIGGVTVVIYGVSGIVIAAIDRWIDPIRRDELQRQQRERENGAGPTPGDRSAHFARVAEGRRSPGFGGGRAEAEGFPMSRHMQVSNPASRTMRYRDAEIMRDQVREDMRRSLRVIPSNRVRKEQ